MLCNFLRSCLALCTLLWTGSTLACSCATVPFLEMVQRGNTDHIIQFRPSETHAAEPGAASYVEGEVIDQFLGELTATRIEIRGGDGISCLPYATNFDPDRDWLLALSEFGGNFTLNACHSLIEIVDESVIGHITPLRCSDSPSNDTQCFTLTQAERESVNSEQMSIAEFESALELFSSAVNFTLHACTGPWDRCQVRPSYDPDTGELILPSVDIISYPFNYGVSARMRLREGTPATFEVLEVD